MLSLAEAVAAEDVLDGVDDTTPITPATPITPNGFVDSPVSLTERVKKRRYAKDALQRAMLCPVYRSSSELDTLQGLGLVEMEPDQTAEHG